MAKLNAHWTERNVDDFLYRIASDFVRHIETLLENRGNQAELAKALNVSQGRISQVLNNPGNLTLKQIIKYARALGQKVSIVAYDDGDSDNKNGPIDSDIFVTCWERAGRPADYFDLHSEQKSSGTPRYGEPFILKAVNVVGETSSTKLGSGPAFWGSPQISRL